MNTQQYLDAIKGALGVSSDYGLQGPLGVTKSAVSNYRNGRSTFDDVVAARVARILKLDPLKVLADAQIERARTDEQRAIWQRIARRAAGVLLPVTLGAGSALAPAPADAAMLRCSEPAVYYVKFRELLRLLGFPIPDDMLA